MTNSYHKHWFVHGIWENARRQTLGISQIIMIQKGILHCSDLLVLNFINIL